MTMLSYVLQIFIPHEQTIQLMFVFIPDVYVIKPLVSTIVGKVNEQQVKGVAPINQ
jgi:hypothetical protein